MINRRKFIGTTLAAAAAAQARPIFASETRGIQGANDRIRVGLIGCGNRGGQVSTDWIKHKDSVFVAACDVASDRLEKMSASLGTAQGNKLDTYEDYRKILERKDVDAVLIATPDTSTRRRARRASSRYLPFAGFIGPTYSVATTTSSNQTVCCSPQ